MAYNMYIGGGKMKLLHVKANNFKNCKVGLVEQKIGNLLDSTSILKSGVN